MRCFLLLLLLDSCSSEIVQLFAIWRHGDRAPDGLPYPKDPYNETFWPRGWDQLTEEGIRQTYALGRWLRRRYAVDSPLLSQDFNREEVLFRSSNEDRAVESAQAVAAGFYPTDDPVIRDEKLGPIPWKPVPIYTASYGIEDPLLRPSGVKCPAVKSLIKKNTERLERDINQRYARLFRKLENYTGFSDVNFKNVKKLNGIRLEMHHNLAQPEWINEKWNGTTILEHVEELKRITRLSNFDSREKSKIKAGVLLNELAGQMEATSRGLPHRKGLFYSAHDGTLNVVMYTLNIGNHLLVPYAATLIAELHKEDDQYFVKFLYKNETERAYPLTMPNCTELCPLPAFLWRTADARVSDLQKMKELCNGRGKTNAALTPIVLLLVFLG